MGWECYGQTHIGLRRKKNQDAILMEPDLNLYAVADGMGGHKGGETASRIAIETLSKSIKDSVKDPNFLPEKALPKAIQTANTEVYNTGQNNEQKYAGMGTTLVVCMISKDTAYFANVGDSRAYLSQNSQLFRITEDHSILNLQLKKGLITEEQKNQALETNVITRSIGFLPDIEIDSFQRKVAANSKFLLCSDGLCGLVKDNVISKEFKEDNLEKLSNRLIQLALDAGGLDNVSVVVVSN